LSPSSSLDEIANWTKPGSAACTTSPTGATASGSASGWARTLHLGGLRSRDPGGLLEYAERIERGLGRIPDPAAELASDTAMLLLRLDSGLDLARYGRRFGAAARERVAVGIGRADASLLEWLGDRARLTPRGRLLAYEVFVSLLT